jgi:polar amino acid transport system substrate-binding protein
MFYWSRFWALAALAFGLALSGQASADPIRVAVDPTWPPMELVDGSGRIVGFSVDYFQAVCREAGCELELSKEAWDDIFIGLTQGRWDMVISSVTITPERRREMNFSIPYYIVRQSLVTRADSSIASLRQLTGLRVGVQGGTTAEDLLAKTSEAKVIPFEEIEGAIEALAKGELEAVVCEDIVAQAFIETPNFLGRLKIATVVETPGAEELYGAALRPDDLDLLILINDGIKAVRDKGLDEAVHIKWFGASNR